MTTNWVVLVSEELSPQKARVLLTLGMTTTSEVKGLATLLLPKY
jgi:hypothetical protein